MLRWTKSAVVYQVRPERVGKILFVCQKSRTQIVAYCACVKSSQDFSGRKLEDVRRSADVDCSSVSATHRRTIALSQCCNRPERPMRAGGSAREPNRGHVHPTYHCRKDCKRLEYSRVLVILLFGAMHMQMYMQGPITAWIRFT